MEIFPGGNVQVRQDDDKCVLQLKNISPHDAGEITCELKNKSATVSAACKLNVQGTEAQCLLSVDCCCDYSRTPLVRPPLLHQ